MKYFACIITFMLILGKSIAQVKGCSNCTDSISWVDVEGKKMIKTIIVERGKIGTRNWDNRINAFLIINKGDSLVKASEINESASEMNGILYFKNSIKLINVEKGETAGYFFYELVKDGLDDNTLKLISFYKNNKIVIVGNVPRQSERSDKIRFIKKHVDSVPAQFISILTTLWKKEANARMRKYISELE